MKEIDRWVIGGSITICIAIVIAWAVTQNNVILRPLPGLGLLVFIWLAFKYNP